MSFFRPPTRLAIAAVVKLSMFTVSEVNWNVIASNDSALPSPLTSASPIESQFASNPTTTKYMSSSVGLTHVNFAGIVSVSTPSSFSLIANTVA